MSKFQVGDRVNVYGFKGVYGGFKAIVARLGNGGEFIWVETLDERKIERFVHVKQCRKLIPKNPRQRVWVFKEGYKTGVALSQYVHIDEDMSEEARAGGKWIEFIEVRKKSKESSE